MMRNNRGGAQDCLFAWRENAAFPKEMLQARRQLCMMCFRGGGGAAPQAKITSYQKQRLAHGWAITCGYRD